MTPGDYAYKRIMVSGRGLPATTVSLSHERYMRMLHQVPRRDPAALNRMLRNAAHDLRATGHQAKTLSAAAVHRVGLELVRKRQEAE